MKKLVLLSICMAGVMMACTNKGKTGAGDGVDSDSVAMDSMEIVEEVDTTPMPMFVYIQNPKDMMMLYSEGDSIEDNFRRNRALYTKLINEKNKCLGIQYIGEQLKDPDGDDASRGEIHGRDDIPAAGMKYAFTDEKFNARNIGGMYVAVTDEYLASRKLIDMGHLNGNNSLPKDVVKKLEAQYKMKASRSMLTKKGNKYGYGVLQFAGKYKTVKENDEKYDKCLALEVITDGDKVYSIPVEGYLIDGQPTWHVDDDGEYYPSDIILFEAPDSTLEVTFIKWAPESCTTGMYFVRDGKMSQLTYTMYQSMIDEGEPLWRKDIAQMTKLYEAFSPENKKHKFCKYRWLDIDDDGKQEMWLRAEDDKHGALFTRVGGKWKMMAVEDGDENTLDEILPEGLAIWWRDFDEKQKK